MADYIGEKCIVCGKTFVAGDDIVVCPECGTPYHRECYKKEGRCINTGLHSTGNMWQGEKQKEEKRNVIRCTNCGTENSPEANNCIKCGAPLKENNFNNNSTSYSNYYNSDANTQNSNNSSNQNNNTQRTGFSFTGEDGKTVNLDDPYAGLNPESTIGGAKVKNLSEFIGSNRFYLILLFKKFSETASRFSANLACIFFPALYFAYRRMWKWFWIVTAVFTVIDIPNVLYNLATMDSAGMQQIQNFASNGDYEMISNLMNAISDFLEPHKVAFWNLYVIGEGISLGSRVLFFCFANYLYYRYAVAKTHKIETTESPENVAAVCREQGGAKASGVIIGIILDAVVNIVVVMLLFMIVVAMI